MSDTDFVEEILELFDVHESNEYYTDEEFVRDCRNLIFKYQVTNSNNCGK